jgi:hypothetical protein
VRLVRELGGDRRSEWLAAFLILSHPGLNRFRTVLVRDPGLWAFGLLAVGELVRFERTRLTSAALSWALCGMITLVFRPEAITLLAVGPLAIVVGSPRLREGMKLAMRLFAAPLAVLIAVAGWMWLHPAALRELRHGTLYLFQPLTGAFTSAATGLAGSFPSGGGREYAPYILLWGLAAVPFVKTVKATGLAISILAAACPFIGARPPSAFGRGAVWLSLAAWAVPTYAFLLKMLFLETRYALFASLLISLWAPFGLTQLTRVDAPRRARAAAYVLIGLLGAGALGAVLFPPAPQDHLVAAVDWLRHNTPETSRVHTNSLQIAYYSRRTVEWEAVQHAMQHGPVDAVIFRPDYWAVRIDNGDTALERTMEARPGLRRIVRFVNRQGEAVILFRSVPPG